MTERDADVQAFLDAVRAGYEAARMDADTRRCVRDVYAALEASVGSRNEGGHRLPACASLGPAIDLARSAGPLYAAIADAFMALEPCITWTRRETGANASANVLEGHAHAMVAGLGGVEARDDVKVGLSLMTPNVRYFDHRHPPEETYLLLTPGEFRHGDDGDWFEPGIGGTFYNHPGMLHAMRSAEAPLLAVWCLRHATS